jgi:hypothetical protein
MKTKAVGLERFGSSYGGGFNRDEEVGESENSCKI